jgi:hypothetical protein
LLLLAGCTTKPTGPPPEELVIAFSADTRGELYKCGCKSAQIGGVARRTTAIKDMGDVPKLIVDCGNFAPASKGLFYDLKAEAVIETFTATGYDAINVGVNEINQGKDFILDANKKLGGKLISANVLDPEGNLLVQPYVTKDFGSLRVGIIGLTYHQTHLTHPSRAKKSTVITRDPMEALETYLPQMVERDKCDMIVIASWIQQKEIEKIAENYDGRIDVILTGYGFKLSERKGEYAYYYRKPETEGPEGDVPVIRRDEENKIETSIILHKTGSSGKYIGKIYAPVVKGDDGSLRLGDFEGTSIDLGDRLADDPGINEILDRFHAKVRENLEDLISIVVTQRPLYYCQDYPDYIGNRWCSECHSDEHISFSRSAHSRSMQPLNRKEEGNNPDCLPCHTTGYGEEWGFTSVAKTHHLSSVGCEECHGTAKEHLCLETQIKEADKANKRRRATEEQIALLDSLEEGYDHKIRKEVPEEICLQCHTEEWSPEFDYETYLLLVKHKLDVATPEYEPGSKDLESLRKTVVDGGTVKRTPSPNPPEEEKGNGE